MSDQLPERQSQSFAQELDAYTPNLLQALPANVSVEKFKRVLTTAVGMNPELYHANRRTFFTAAVRCAADGLLPDGREAALVVYRTKMKRRDPQTGIDREVTVNAVTYMPMIAGIRKRMRNSGDVLSARAEVVYANDHFKYKLGDNSMIEHEPPGLGQDRGAPVGAYAIITLRSGEVLRDVLNMKEIEAARHQGRATNSLMWTKFWSEGAKKTALRRCAKAAPQSAEIEALLSREEEPPLLPHDHLPALPEPEPERQDFVEAVEEAGGYEVVDPDGSVNIFINGDRAIAALHQVLQDAARLGRDRLIGCWESNQNVLDELGHAGEDAADVHDAYTSMLAYFQAPSPQGAAERPRPSESLHQPAEGVPIQQPERRVPREAPPTPTPLPAASATRPAATAAYAEPMGGGGANLPAGPGPTAQTSASPSDDGFQLTAPAAGPAQGSRAVRMVYDRNNRPDYRLWLTIALIPAMRKVTTNDELAWFFADNDEEIERACRVPEQHREFEAAKAAQWAEVARLEREAAAR